MLAVKLESTPHLMGSVQLISVHSEHLEDDSYAICYVLASEEIMTLCTREISVGFVFILLRVS